MSFVHTISGWAVPVIAATGVFIAGANYLLARQKRKDELFDRRYEFFKQVQRQWQESVELELGDDRPAFDKYEVDELAQEAEFLFGDDIAKHLRRYADKNFEGEYGILDQSSVKPFARYLKLGS